MFSKPIDGWADTSEGSELTASDGSDYDQFGESVAVSGNTVVVGAYLADLDDDEENFGAAYVFTRPSGGWEDTTDSVKLTAPDGARGREFGQSLSMTGDTLVIGAPYSGYRTPIGTYREAREAEDKTPYLGSVYVYTRPETGWADAASPVKLTAPNGIPWTRFGWSVSVSSDAIAVGEPYSRRSREPGGYEYSSGAAYVFAKPSEGWSSTAEHRELPMPDIMPYDHYGSSVFTSGEVVVVGARDDDNENGLNAGSAYLFRMPTDGWASVTPLPDPVTLRAFDGPAGDRFGHSVAVDGEMLVIGVPGDHAQGDRSSLRFRQAETPNGTTEGSRWTRPRPSPAVGSGLRQPWAKIRSWSARPAQKSGNDPGAAYVFIRPEDGWDRKYSISSIAKLTIPDAPADGRYGYSVATDGTTIVVGAPGAGAAYVYTRPDMGWAQMSAHGKTDGLRRRIGQPIRTCRFRIRVTPIVVGTSGRGRSGHCICFHEAEYGYGRIRRPQRKLTASNGASGDRFGYSVSASGSTVLVGAPGNENGEGLGAAYVFTEPDTGWSTTSVSAKLTASDGSAGDWFGHAVSVSDEFIAVGAYGSDIVTGTQESLDSGAVYAFRRPQDGWVSSSNAQKLTTKDPASGDTFGYAVAVSGDTLAVGLPSAIVRRDYYLRGAHSGAARVFSWPGLYWGRHPRGVQDQTAQRRIFPYLRSIAFGGRQYGGIGHGSSGRYGNLVRWYGEGLCLHEAGRRMGHLHTRDTYAARRRILRLAWTCSLRKRGHCGSCFHSHRLRNYG